MTVEREVFEAILEYFQKKKVVERLIKATDKKGTFNKIQGSLQRSLGQLREEMKTPMKDREIYPNEVLEFCTLCLMAGMDDFDFIANYNQLLIPLKQVEGDKQETADNFLNFLSMGGVFTEEQPEELVEKFFTQTPD